MTPLMWDVKVCFDDKLGEGNLNWNQQTLFTHHKWQIDIAWGVILRNYLVLCALGKFFIPKLGKNKLQDLLSGRFGNPHVSKVHYQIVKNCVHMFLELLSNMSKGPWNRRGLNGFHSFFRRYWTKRRNEL